VNAQALLLLLLLLLPCRSSTTSSLSPVCDVHVLDSGKHDECIGLLGML
jgi:hypothetical protein